MVLDTSVLVAILCGEPEAPALEATIEVDPIRLISAATVLEAGIVIERRFGTAGGAQLDLLLYQTQVEIVPVDREQVEMGREAYRQFGKGRHPAALNFGDCFAYALARISGEPLLFKGGDFSKTDINPVSWSSQPTAPP